MFKRSVLAPAGALVLTSVWFNPAQASTTDPTATIDIAGPVSAGVSCPDAWFRFLRLTNGTYTPDTVEAAIRTIYPDGITSDAAAELLRLVKHVDTLGLPETSSRSVRETLISLLPAHDAGEYAPPLGGALGGMSYRLAQVTVADGLCEGDATDPDCPPDLVGAVPGEPSSNVGGGYNN